MTDVRRTLLTVGAIGVAWAVLWPAIGLAVVAALTVILGPDGDVTPLEIVAILAPLGLWSGLLFACLAGVTQPHAREIPSLFAFAVLGGLAAVAVGAVTGLQPGAISNALVLGAVSGPASTAIARRLHESGLVRV